MPQNNPLARLIEDHRKATGESYAAIARRGNMARSVVHALANNVLVQQPRRETLSNLAKGLGLSEASVRRAAQIATGYEVYLERTPHTDTEILIANVEKLTPEERAKVAALIEKLLAKRSE